MNTSWKNPLGLLGLTLCLMLPQPAQAFYNPSTGRWLSRDPVEEGGGRNLYCFVHNDCVRSFDSLGQIRFGDDNWGCRMCRCKDVDLNFEPGGDNFELGWYEVGWPASPTWRFGNAIHVHWNVIGDPAFCRYFQDEAGTELRTDWIVPAIKPSITIGVNGNEVPQAYTDKLGFDQPPAGSSLKWSGTIKITFRCVDSKPFSDTKTRTITKRVPPIVITGTEVP
jgi:hypothetical protein